MNRQNLHDQAIQQARAADPGAYLHSRGLITQPTKGEWATIKCPVHKSGNESRPSMRVNRKDGHFRCMACGVKGGDLIALHRVLTGASFTEAVRAVREAA